MKELRSFLAICAVAAGIAIFSLRGLAEGEEPPERPGTHAPLCDEEKALIGMGLLCFSVWLWAALFRAFTPPDPPYVVKYVSPKIDPEELRNL